MEIKIQDKKTTITISDKEMNGVTGSEKESIIGLLNLNEISDEKVKINGEEVKKSEYHSYKQKIRVIEKDFDPFYESYKVYECMYHELKTRRLELKNPKKKIVDSLKIVGLDVTYLNRNIHDLSESEKKLLQIGVALMANPEVMIFIEPFERLDMKKERLIATFLLKIKEEYHKTIVYVSDNGNMLYHLTTHLIVATGDETIEGDTEKMYQDVSYMKKHKIRGPEGLEFIDLVKKKKNVKLEANKDIRDMIKDIYKHV